MVLILDHTKSQRAIELRRKILAMKIPCAVSAVWNCAELLPASCIITFEDVLEKVYRYPLEKYTIFVMSNGWINSALPVVQCTGEEQLLHKVYEAVCETAGIRKENYLSGGVYLENGFLLTAQGLFYKCFPLILHDTEFFVLLMLILQKGNYCSARQLIAYCYPDTYKGNSKNSATCAVYRINKHIVEQSGIKLISYSKKHGGYTLDIRVVNEI